LNKPSFLSPFNVAVILGLGFLAIFILYPILFVIFGSLWSARPGLPGHVTPSNFIAVFTDIKTLELMINTITYALGSALFAVSIAVLLSFITTRTDTPLRGLFYFVPFLPLVLPGMVDNLVWIYLFSERSGLINIILKDLGFPGPIFNIHSMGGMIWTMGLSLVPLSFLTISAVMRSMDPSLEEAARMAGSGIRKTLVGVTLPLMLPGILSVFLLDFVIAMESFETPAMIGIPAKIDVFMSVIYQSITWSVPPKYGLGASQASVVLAVTMLMVYIYRKSTRRAQKFQVVTGKGYNPRVINLGRWKYVTLAIMIGYLVIHVGLLFFTVGILSLQPFWDPRDIFSRITLHNYQVVLAHPRIFGSFINSIMASTGAATLAMLAAFIIAYVANRTRIRGKGYLEALGMLPISVPGLVIGVGLLWAFLTIPTGLYGTIGIIILAYTLRYLPHSLRTTSGSMIQIHTELEEASRISGAGTARTMRRVLLPLLKPALIGTWIYVFIASFKALGEVILITTPSNEVLATVLWDLWDNGNPLTLAAASSLLIMILWTVVIASVVVLKIRIR